MRMARKDEPKGKAQAVAQDHEPTRRGMPLPSIPARRGSDQVLTRAVSPAPRSESPVPRITSPVPKTAAQTSSLSRATSPSAIPDCYRKPEPLPLSPPPRAQSPIGAHFQPPVNVQEQIVAPPPPPPVSVPPPRARSPPPSAMPPSRAKAVQAQIRDNEDTASQRSRGSRASKDKERERDDTGYLPVAQLRPPMSRQGTAQSTSSTGRRPTKERAGSGSTAGGHSQVSDSDMREREREREWERERERERERDRADRSQPVRTKSPEPLRVPVKTKPPPLKDMDSPLPPPPMPVPEIRSPPKPSRSATVKAMTSPMPLVSSPTEITPPPVSQPRRQRTAPPTPAMGLTSPALTSQSHPNESFVHGRSCSPTQSSSNKFQTYPPSDFDEDAVPTRDQIVKAASLVVIAQNGIRKLFGDLFKDRKAIVIFLRHFWYVFIYLLR